LKNIRKRFYSKPSSIFASTVTLSEYPESSIMYE